MDLFRQLALQLKHKYKKFSLVAKEDSKLMRFFGWISHPFSPYFMTDYATTIGYTVYMPRDWIGTSNGYAVLRHEAVHVKDYHKFKWLMSISSVLLLPTILTMRAFWEYRAYVESMRAEFDLTGTIDPTTVSYIAEEFTGISYGWMFPFKKTITKLLNKKRIEILND